MSDESKTTQQKIDQIIEQLEVNGKLADEQAAGLPACLAHIEDGEKFELVAETFHTFRRMWAHWPDVQPLTEQLCWLVERERVRRALSEGWEIGQLTKLSEL